MNDDSAHSMPSLDDRFALDLEYILTKHVLLLELRPDPIPSLWNDHIGAALGNRPHALAMLQAAQANTFDALVVMDLSRLSRSQADLPKMIDRLTARGVRVIGIQDGYDSLRKGHKLQAGLSGILGEAFREMVADKTYAALESRALGRRPTGGRAYGYTDVVADEAVIVREIFERFANGEGLRAICETLNARGVAAPGAQWRRTKRRQDGKWLASSLFSLLRNSRYRGEVTWNRAQWRKDSDTGKRLRRDRPESAWIRHQDESLRILPEAV